MQVGDLVFVPYYGEYGTLTKQHPNRTWRVVYTDGLHSNEYKEDVEVVQKKINFFLDNCYPPC